MTNKSDLISREALKEALAKEIKTNDLGLWLKILLVIDNAPAVNFIISPDYVTELQNLNKELIKQLEEVKRSQGEWEDYSVDFYKCPECGYLLNKDCPCCQNKVILPKGGAEE